MSLQIVAILVGFGLNAVMWGVSWGRQTARLEALEKAAEKDRTELLPALISKAIWEHQGHCDERVARRREALG